MHPAWAQRVRDADPAWAGTTAQLGRQLPQAVQPRASGVPLGRQGPRERREPLGQPVPMVAWAAALPEPRAWARGVDLVWTAWPANRWPLPGC